MGYTLTIGNAEVSTCETQYGCTVHTVTCGDAPAAENDCNSHKSCRWPSYTVWADFCDNTGLRDVFYDEESGLLRPHPGCAILTEEHATRFESALAAFRTVYPDAVPRFERDPRIGENMMAWHDDITANPKCGPHDGNLARLEWLAWWTRWAVEHCERPAMFNS